MLSFLCTSLLSIVNGERGDFFTGTLLILRQVITWTSSRRGLLVKYIQILVSNLVIVRVEKNKEKCFIDIQDNS